MTAQEAVAETVADAQQDGEGAVDGGSQEHADASAAGADEASAEAVADAGPEGEAAPDDSAETAGATDTSPDAADADGGVGAGDPAA